MSAARPGARAGAPSGTSPLVPGLWAIVGFLVAVELASGVLQGYYTPIFSDIADHLGIPEGDVNWFEAAQLMVSALAVPLLARLGDLWGHRNVLLVSTAVTALGSWMLAFSPGFWTFLVGWALQGAYVVWLPVEVAIIHRRTSATREQDRLTRRAAAVLVAALEAGVIVGALTSGALVEATSMPVLLALPAVAVTLCFVVIWFGIERDPGVATGGYDFRGLGLLTVVLGLVMAGLVVVRLEGVGSPWPWLLLLAGAAFLGLLVRVEAATPEPLVDVRLLATPGQWPVQLTAFLFGMSVLGAQIPLSTFARADPEEVGYGLGVDAATVSTFVGVYVVTMLVGALLLPLATRLLGPRGAMVGGLLLVALGYGLFLPLHGSVTEMLTNLGIAGLGSGLLVAALPAAAAAAAPPDRTGFATGMTNATKTVGGAIASAVFAIALTATGSLDEPGVGAAPLSGYLTVWGLCSGSALLAALALLAVPRAGAPTASTASAVTHTTAAAQAPHR
ncbi:MFS transporter [Nocardioides sp. ChNu-99]|uniref:MFS transporter n=1 Tax=Nocardioides sp. ChNu-99 TaxID=2839897 RepID=UPI002405D4E6|nr:MFS transporter [Nocardioides sp. ChNu-99]